MAKHSKAIQKEIDEAFYSGVCAALAAVTTFDDSAIWREIVSSACDPRELRAWAERNDLLEGCGFVTYEYEYQQIVKEDLGQFMAGHGYKYDTDSGAWVDAEGS